MKVRNSKGELKELVIKANDSIPAGAVIDFEGDVVPEGYEQVEDKGEIYSTEEQRVGTWIDGKPLYRKTIETIVNNQQQTISLDFSIDKLKKVEGGLDNGNQVIPFGYNDNTNYCCVFIQKSNKSLYYMSSWSKGTLYITLEYTKTTD